VPSATRVDVLAGLMVSAVRDLPVVPGLLAHLPRRQCLPSALNGPAGLSDRPLIGGTGRCYVQGLSVKRTAPLVTPEALTRMSPYGTYPMETILAPSLRTSPTGWRSSVTFSVLTRCARQVKSASDVCRFCSEAVFVARQEHGTTVEVVSP